MLKALRGAGRRAGSSPPTRDRGRRDRGAGARGLRAGAACRELPRRRPRRGWSTAINARGYGLTFGLHSRIDDRVERVTARIHVGNTYVNRNQIGAIVGSQPFGGEGLSGTGPKAGGPHYLPRLQRAIRRRRRRPAAPGGADGRRRRRLRRRSTPAPGRVAPDRIDALRRIVGRRIPALDGRRARCAQAPLDLPGPTGESNRLSLHPRGRVLVLGAGAEDALAQAMQALAPGNAVLAVAEGAGGARAARAAGLPVARPRRAGRPGGADRAAGARPGRGARSRGTGCGRCAARSRRAPGRSWRSRPGASRRSATRSSATSASTPPPRAATPACSRPAPDMAREPDRVASPAGRAVHAAAARARAARRR